MLDWLTSRLRKDKDTHPFRTDKGIGDALSSLPSNQPLVVLAEIGQWLAEAEQLKADLDPRSLANAVRRLDEHVQDALREAWFRMLSDIAKDGLREDAWLALETYYGQAAQAYCTAIDAVVSGGKAADADKNALALLLLRALHALAERKKLLRMRYRYADAAHWKRLHELFAFGRKQALNHLSLKAYPGEEATAPLSEYLCALVLEMAPLENLSPQQVACADLLIRKHQKLILFREEPGDTTPFHVDTAGESGPGRLAPGQARSEGERYFGTGSLAGHIFTLCRSIENAGNVPEWIGETGCEKEDLLSLCKALGEHWSAQPPKRRHPRRQAEAMIKAVNGFAQTRRMVAASSFARAGKKIGYQSYADMMSLHRAKFGHAGDPAQAPPPAAEGAQSPMDVLHQLELAGDRLLMEEWILLDISATGMGAIVPHHKKWLGIGTLVGFRPEESLDWRIGIIRRLGRSSQGRRQAGLEVLPGTPVSAQYRELGDAPKASPWLGVPGAQGATLRDAILVSRPQRTLLIERQQFAAGQPFRLVVEGEATFHRFGRLLDSGKDFEYVEFEDMAAPPEG